MFCRFVGLSHFGEGFFYFSIDISLQRIYNNLRVILKLKGVAAMAAYRTVQKRILTDYLTKHCEEAFTVEELAEKIKDGGYTDGVPGKSTIYRLIQKLVDDGVVKRFVKGNSRRFVYQIAAGEHCNSHLHLRCIECGRLLHMDDDESLEILARVLKQNNFSIDEKKTVLLGKCAECSPDKGDMKNEE